MHVSRSETVAQQLGGLITLKKEALDTFRPNGVTQRIRLRTRSRDQKGEPRVSS